MLYNFLLHFSNHIAALNVFHYITLRSWAAMLTSLIICFMYGGKIINWLALRQNGGQPIRAEGPESHLKTKKGTPTMGGILMFIPLMISVLLWVNIYDQYVLIVLFVMVCFGLLGFADDYLKVSKRNTKGVPGKVKLLVQFTVALVATLWIQKLADNNLSSHLLFPFFKNWIINLSWFYIPMAMVVIVGASNAVNLTDGLDGLAIGPIMIATACFGLIAYLTGNIKFAEYLQIYFVSGTGELTVLCGAIIGAGLGFLWYNAPPARIFMGDVGSLSLGGALGAIGVITKHEIVLAIVGGLFVIEAISVMIQVAYFKSTGGKRFFGMAPIHHHFEKKGWSEPTVVIRFWIIAIIFAVLGLATLKLR